MKRYYANAEKQRIIEELIVGYGTSLEKDGTFGSGLGNFFFKLEICIHFL